MSITPLNPPLVPGDGKTLKVLIVGRVSDPRPGKQNRERSLGDQEDVLSRWLRDHTDLPVEITVVAGSGSGESLQRKEYLQVLQLIESREFDLILVEDLGRIARRVHTFMVCELCEDSGVRLIAVNNQNVDTGAKGWRDAAFFASFFYERDNSDKSERLKGRLRARFLTGGALERLIFGYFDLPGRPKNDANRRLDPQARRIYRKWFRMLRKGATYQEIADWLNATGVPTGPYCENDKWDSKMVARNTHNTILKGLRQHNKRKTRRHNSTGKYRSEKAAPEELLERWCPHLAAFPEWYCDHVTAVARANNAKFKPGQDGHDPRLGRTKSKTVWPGQHMYCGVCGRLYRYGGHGQNDHLLCRGACEYRCWNAITVDGPKSAQKICQAILDEVAALSGFDSQFAQRLESEVSGLADVRSRRIAELERELSQLDKRLKNTADAISDCGPSPTLRDQLQSLETRKVILVQQRHEAQRMPQGKIHIPSVDEIRDLVGDSFQRLAVESDEFSRLIRQLVPRIVVYPVRLVDGGQPVLRARFLLNLVPLVPDVKNISTVEEILQRWICVDLFDPPQREQFREQVMAEKAKCTNGKRGPTEHQIAATLGITKTAVQYAAALQRKMDAQGLTDPYQILTEPPDDFAKLRRHKHPRFRFEPLADVRIR